MTGQTKYIKCHWPRVSLKPTEMHLDKHQLDFISSLILKLKDSKLIDITTIKGGYSNLTYLIQTDSGKLVLRRAPLGSKGIKGGHDMLREAKILKLLEQAAYHKVPKVIYEGPEESPLETAFYIMEFLEGNIYRTETAAHFLELNDPNYINQICNSLLKEQVTLHQINLSSTGLINLGKPEGYINRQVNGWYQRFKHVELETFTDLEYIKDYLVDHMPLDLQPSLLHNDYKFDNLIFNPQNGDVKAVLDWEMATIGDTRMDLGTTLSYWTESTDGPFEKMFNVSSLPGFIKRAEYLEKYLNLNPIAEPKDLIYFYIFGLFKNAVVIMQIFYRYQKGFSTDPRFANINKVAFRLIEKAKLSLQIKEMK